MYRTRFIFVYCLFFAVFSNFAQTIDEKTLNFDKENVLSLSKRVVDWELAKDSVVTDRYGSKKRGWVSAAFWAGLIDYYKYTKDEAYLQELLYMATNADWEPGPFPFNANAYSIVATYAELYEMFGKQHMIEKSRFMAEMPIERRRAPTVKFKGNPYWIQWWSWCDALFMAPPAYARLGKVLNSSRYTDYMNENWWRTSDYLYNPKDSLYFRDDTFFDKREKNGEHTYWSRGNGWVIGGICRVLDYLPKDYPDRPKFERQFVEMAHRLANIQGPDGHWSTSLLDYASYPGKETSGTAFYCYAFAWGVNNGLLEKEKFMPHITLAWKSLTDAVHPDGMLGYVQKIGDGPAHVKYEDEQSYGAGAFVMAGVQIAKLLEGLEKNK